MSIAAPLSHSRQNVASNGHAAPSSAVANCREPSAKPNAREADSKVIADQILLERPNLKFWAGSWYEWDPSKGYYVCRDDIESLVVNHFNKGWIKLQLSHVKAVMMQLRASCSLPSGTTAPAWLVKDSSLQWDVKDLLVGPGSIFHLPSVFAGAKDCSIKNTPNYFSLSVNGCDYDPNAASPTRWLQFLSEVWPDDPDSIARLQEWFGLMLTSDTGFHKILYRYGTKRGGKSTIERVKRRLVGDSSVAGTHNNK